MDEFYDLLSQPTNQQINLKDTIDIILDFNEELNQIWFERSSAECNSIKNIKIKKRGSNFNWVKQ